MIKNELKKSIKDLLKKELRKKKVTYKQLCEKLKVYGLKETEASIKNKISRCSFSVVFFFQCLKVIDSKVIKFKKKV